MEPYEKAAIEIKAITDLIMLNFLHKPHEETFYYFQKPDESKHIPPLKNQIGILEKIKRDEGISNLKLFKSYATFKLNLEKFNAFQKNFTNPVLSFARYIPNDIAPIYLPENTKWEHIVIKFLNGNDVRITLKNKPDFNRIASFSEMGFRNKKIQKPNEQWYLLILFAKRNGAIFWEKKSNLKIQVINTLKTHKKILSRTLKNLFQLEGDPFFPYNTEDGYKIKLNLIPEKPERLRPEKRDEDSEISDYFQEQTPLVG